MCQMPAFAEQKNSSNAKGFLWRTKMTVGEYTYTMPVNIVFKHKKYINI